MKKLFIAAAVALAAGFFTSCSSTEGCYEITVKWGDTTVSGYVYGTGNDVDKAVEDAKAVYTLIDANAKVTKKKVAKSKEDCTGGSLRI